MSDPKDAAAFINAHPREVIFSVQVLDKDGLPLASGGVFLLKDSSRGNLTSDEDLAKIDNNIKYLQDEQGLRIAIFGLERCKSIGRVHYHFSF